MSPVPRPAGCPLPSIQWSVDDFMLGVWRENLNHQEERPLTEPSVPGSVLSGRTRYPTGSRRTSGWWVYSGEASWPLARVDPSLGGSASPPDEVPRSTKRRIQLLISGLWTCPGRLDGVHPTSHSAELNNQSSWQCLVTLWQLSVQSAELPAAPSGGGIGQRHNITKSSDEDGRSTQDQARGPV